MFDTPDNTVDYGLRCRGTLIADKPCDDNNACTENDRCAFVTPEFDDSGQGGFVACRGDVLVGEPCDDFNECTKNDQCMGEFPGTATCSGTPDIGAPCDDFNQCTINDACVLEDLSESPFCRGGEITVGASCDDDNQCTENDVCIQPDDCCGDTEVFCAGTLLDRVPCDDGKECTVNDECIIFSGTFSTCVGRPVKGCSAARYQLLEPSAE